MNPYDPYYNGYPPQYIQPGAYVVPTTTYVQPMVPPPTVITSMPPPAFGYPQTTYVQPMMQPLNPYNPYPPTTYNYPQGLGGAAIPGVNGYNNRSISGHKFRSGFHVKKENWHQF